MSGYSTASHPSYPLQTSAPRFPSASSSSFSPISTTDYNQSYQRNQPVQPARPQPHSTNEDKRGRDEAENDDGFENGSYYGGGDDSKPQKKKTKGGRAVLSCGECKRRKVKCDRKIPCATCIQRGKPEACSWDDPLANPELQPFALATDYQDVLARLDRIEHFLEALPSDIRSQALKAGSTPSSKQLEAPLPPTPKPKLSNEMDEAAADLEASTFQQQMAAPSPAGLDFLASAIDMVPSHRPSAQIDQHPEPTSFLTSIVGHPIRFEGATKAVSHGLDLCFSQSEMIEQRDRSLDKIYSLLPTPDAASRIIGAYFEDVSWFYTILHPPAFLAEVEKFEEMLKMGRQNEVDLAWLGIFFIVLALGLDGAQSIETPPLPFATKPETTAAWYAASLRLFHLSNWPNQPQFRLVQLVALYGQYNLTSGGGTDMGGFLTYLAIGVRISQKLRLHQLGTDPKTMPPDDIAFPKGINSMKRQTAIRVFGIITFLDVVTANNRMGAYLVHPSQVTTPPPENLNFDQLSATEWRTEPAPRQVWTDSSLELNKGGGGRYMRLVFDRLVTNAKDFTYDTVLELDREMRVHVATFPESMTSENVQQEEKNPKLRKQRFMSMSGAFSRLVRLHRPFLVTGFTNPRYRFSTDACLQSARKVISAHYGGRDFLKNLRIVHSHTLSATIVIYSYIFHLIDTNAPISEIAREKDTAATAYEVFSTTQVTSPMLNKVIKHAVAIISMLGAAVEERQAQRSYRNNGAPAETFVQVLRRIAKQLSLAHSPPSEFNAGTSDHRTLAPGPLTISTNLSSFSTSSSRTTSHEPSSAMTSASSSYQQSPQFFPPPIKSPAPLSSSQSYPAPPLPFTTPQIGGSPPDPGFAAMFLGDLGLSSPMKPGPDVFDLSWLQDTSYTMPASASTSNDSIPLYPQQPQTISSSLTPYYNLSHSSTAHSHPQHFKHSPGGGIGRRSLSPQQPNKGWYLDGAEGAEALYSQIK